MGAIGVKKIIAVLALLVAFLLSVQAAHSVNSTTPKAEDTIQPTDDDRVFADEVRSLGEAWAEGGGVYGYPFWEKAWQRWRSREIPASVFREYVTSYRDLLQRGCRLVSATKLQHSDAIDVQKKLNEACDERLAGLRAQRDQLEAIIMRGAIPVIADNADKQAELKDQIEASERLADEHLQNAWRITRELMDTTQRSLDERGLPRLNETQFI